MPLPSPLPDNPKRWEGWRNYSSKNPYERLCLSYEDSPSAEEIEENCRKLLVWWQKKLPLKNQLSNPMTQLLRVALDEAPEYLVEARTQLLDQDQRHRIDETLKSGVRDQAFAEFHKFLEFVTANGMLNEEQEHNLFEVGARAGLEPDEMHATVDHFVEERGIQRISKEDSEKKTEAVPVAEAAPAEAERPVDPFEQYRHLLRLSGLDDDMTDDQRDALCNMGENLGLTGGQSEDLIDEYLDELSGMPLPAQNPVKPVAPAPKTPAANPEPADAAPKPEKPVGLPIPAERKMEISPLTRALDRRNNPDFTNTVGMEMRCVPSGMFPLGSDASGASPNEQPVSEVSVTCFLISRHPVTNAQYERFDPSHRSKRAPWADDTHPVTYVSSREAENFCKWLSARERKTYRLPTEAEWEYAARGNDGRIFPWGEQLNRGDVANFADSNTSFPWRDGAINDGYAQTSPVGAYPRGASPFSLEDMAGNVHEWCLDFFAEYQARARTNPRGPSIGTKRIYRGGSWKSRANSLRVSSRAFNQPDYSSNDVGFRALCEAATLQAE